VRLISQQATSTKGLDENTMNKQRTTRKRLVRSVTALGAVALVAGSLTAGLAGVASAAGNPPWEPVANPPEAGGLLFFNAAGQQITGGSVSTSPLAAYVEGTTVLNASDDKATLKAYTPVNGVPAGTWSGEQLSSSTVYPNASAPAPLTTSTLPVVTGSSSDVSLATYVLSFPNDDTSSDGYAGLYVLRLISSNPTTTTSYDSADIQITGSTWSVVYPAPTLTSTTTTLTTTPASPQTQGTSVTLNASVSPSAPGTVQFEVGSTDIGTPVTVTGGTASTTTTTLPLGSDSLSAVFTPQSGSAYSGSTGTASYTISSAPATPTTTTLTTSPSSPQFAGTSVTLNASINQPAPGTVQFEVGSTDIGSPVAVVDGASTGTASIATTSLPTGSDNLSAVFTPQAGSGYAGSTGTASYTINPQPATPTTTALSVDPTTGPAFTAITLTAAVTNTSSSAALAAGDGTVTFYDDGTDASGDITSSSVALGTANLAAGGIGTVVTTDFAPGTHNIVVQFTPADSGVYNSSTSPAVLLTTTSPTSSDPQDLQVSIPTGTLTITTPYTPSNPFQLGTASLNPGGGYYTASAPFGSTSNPSQGVTITDTGIGNNTWTASASVTDFTNGPTNTINGQNLTFTGVVPNYIAGNQYGTGAGDIPVTTTDVTNNGTVYAAGASGSDGLKGGPHQFASIATPGAGSAYVDGLLTLTAPSSAAAGTYTATLTFTVV
jgi:hypothetical protein